MTGHWPPAADGATRWGDVTPAGSREPVRVREVPLWGQLVWIAQLDGEWRVWCPSCLQFRTTRELGAPGNGCPVGVIRSSGTIVHFAPGDDGPKNDPLAQGLADVMRTSW